uniref:Cytochrome b6-f complex subunit 7 n=1 Tax=Cliftonaea pectinata TaxID=2007206 RepID=A0A1Z1MR08_9FLOR|nr:cytochrome b6-f complex subunit 7 [Cliftonaea pectinata]ARW68191.1 cytochrome b6-f complex subunit 7 [Cliftonaea pectinata]
MGSEIVITALISSVIILIGLGIGFLLLKIQGE